MAEDGQATRIIVVEDEGATREALMRSISAVQDFELVAACATFEAGSEAITTNAFEVLVTDLQLPDGNGIELIRLARRVRAEAELMVISVLGDETTVVSAISAGASGFLLKDAQQIDIANAVRDLLAGRSPISTAVARYIIRLVQFTSEVKARPEGLAPVHLTARELDILWGIAKGFTYRDVAERLGLSPNTIPTYIKSIYRKLEVNSRGEAVFEALQRGLIEF